MYCYCNWTLMMSKSVVNPFWCKLTSKEGSARFLIKLGREKYYLNTELGLCSEKLKEAYASFFYWVNNNASDYV